MKQILTGKNILVFKKNITSNSFLVNYLLNFGANIITVNNNLHLMKKLNNDIDLIFYDDLNFAKKNMIKFVNNVRFIDFKIPIIILFSKNYSINSIANILRLGINYIIHHPLKNNLKFLNTIMHKCFYQKKLVINENNNLFQKFNLMNFNSLIAKYTLKKLQPPSKQIISNCYVEYNYITLAQNLGLILDIAELSKNELGFYCLDISNTGKKGIIVAFLLRSLFNNLIKEIQTKQKLILPNLNIILKQLNLFLIYSKLQGKYPILAGYYNSNLNNLNLISGGLEAKLYNNKNENTIYKGMTLGNEKNIRFSQINKIVNNWRCNINGYKSKLFLIVSKFK